MAKERENFDYVGFSFRVHTYPKIMNQEEITKNRRELIEILRLKGFKVDTCDINFYSGEDNG